MKTKLLCFAATLLASMSALTAAPLSVTTAVHTKPDSASPAITFLKAGTEPVAAMDPLSGAPSGWMAVELPGPFEGYVQNKDLSKSLDVKPGAPIHVAPKLDAGVLAVAAKGDKASITGLRGRWTQISLEKKLVGYIKVSGGSAPLSSSTPTASASTGNLPRSGSSATASAGTTAAAVPAPQPVYASTSGPGQAAPMVDRGDGGATALPRQFAGRFVSTRRAFTPRRPYDYALTDDGGRRYAYLDVSKLLLTEQIEKYIDHQVVVFGAAKTVPDSKDIVITVETLQLN